MSMAMMIDGAPSDWFDLFNARKLHLVALSVGGFSTLGAIEIRIGYHGPYLSDSVNRSGRARTFAPEHPLTVIPLVEDTHGGRPLPPDPEAFLRKVFRDVLRAHASLDDCRAIFLDLRGWGRGDGFPIETARRAAAKVFAKAGRELAVYIETDADPSQARH
ncbi:MAG: hypothetical protein DWI09_11540 [Planctomycetota bacterium]|nr:MAG: hypothetical protein DWI09_11540 [Planctomycetota bacterium]